MVFWTGMMKKKRLGEEEDLSPEEEGETESSCSEIRSNPNPYDLLWEEGELSSLFSKETESKEAWIDELSMLGISGGRCEKMTDSLVTFLCKWLSATMLHRVLDRLQPCIERSTKINFWASLELSRTKWKNVGRLIQEVACNIDFHSNKRKFGILPGVQQGDGCAI
ncbi:hypothetical protein HAX54_023153 [Datura stramonium]|uniref:Uncharacterized protein n=1 Tax=Datura stramonium TaxID=4076 RepID=A0ABS8UY53_DATST|nr:hypothetical protein [Datura stramonium]